MNRLWLAGALVAATLGSAVAADAQPAPSQQLAIDLSGAAVDACNEKGLGIVAVVTDSVGAPVASSTGAGAPDSAEDTADQAARAAMATPATKVPGVLPVRIGGRLVGAIAVAGAPAPADNTACAQAALAKLADRLR